MSEIFVRLFGFQSLEKMQVQVVQMEMQVQVVHAELFSGVNESAGAGSAID